MTEALLLRHTLLLSGALLALALLRPLVQRAGGAGALYGLWLAVPAVLLAPLLPTPQWGQAAAPWQQVMGGVAALAPAAQVAAPALRTGLPWLPLWAAGALSLAALLVWQQWRYQRLRRGHRLPAGMSPAWLGLWQGRLCLPRDFRQRFDARERRLIRAHERVHAQRKDNLWTLLATLLWLLNWFNPLAWWALRRMRGDQELAADAQVLHRHPGELGPYLRALAKAQPGLAPLGAGAPFASPFSPHPLIERIRMMKSHTARRSRPWVGLLATLALLGSAWAMNPADSMAAPDEGPEFVVMTTVRERTVDQRVVRVPAQHGTAVRLNAYGDRDLLLTLKAKPTQAQAHEVSALLTLGFPAVTFADGQSELTRGKLLRLAVKGSESDAPMVVVTIAPLVKVSEGPPLDPDQSGQVSVDLQFFVDGKPLGQRAIKGPFGQSLALALGPDAEAKLQGELKASARLPSLVDLAFKLRVNGQTLHPRVVTEPGVKAVVEFSEPGGAQILRLEATPMRTLQ